MVDKYLSDIKPKEIFDTLSEEEKNILLDRQLSRKYNSKNNDLGGNK